jgi:MFS family permease
MTLALGLGIDNPDGRRSARLFVSLVTATAALGGLLFGYDTGIISGALLFLKTEFGLTPNMQAFVTSAALAGAALGAAFGGYLADRFGRRSVMLVLAIWFVVGSLICAMAHSVQLLIAGRALLGSCIGIVSFVGPLYIAEVAPANRRGSLVSLNQLAITVGILASYVVGYLYADSGSWRWMVGLGAVPGIILGVGMAALPESPRWLMKQTRGAEARIILAKVRAGEDVDHELAEIQAELNRESQTIGWGSLFTPATRRPMLLGIGLAVLQQTTGIGAVIYYAPTILTGAGFHSASTAILATSGVGLVLTGLVGMALSLGLFSFGLAFHADSSMFKWFAVGSMTSYVGFFAIGLGPVFWLLIAEIFPLTIRGRAMGIASLTIWVFNILSALLFFQLLEWIGQAATFAGYALLTVVGWIFVFRYMPETKGLTLEKIEQYWMERRPVARWAP